MSGSESDNPMFSGAPGEPDPGKLEVAWDSRFPRRAYFVGPASP